MGRFDGRVALITGAASGIGRATAIRMAADGATIVGFDRDTDGLTSVATEITRVGGALTTVAGDVSVRADCIAAVDVAVSVHGRLDVLANVAGVTWAEHVADITETGWRQMMDVNVSGTLWCAQAALPHLIENRGNIINIASNAGLMGQAYTVAYSAAKGAVVNMTRALAMEYAKQPVRINAVAPGGVDSPMSRDFAMPNNLDHTLMQPLSLIHI